MIKLYLLLMMQTIIAGIQIQTSSNAKHIFYTITSTEKILLAKKIDVHKITCNHNILAKLSHNAKEKIAPNYCKKKLLKSDKSEKNPFYLIILLILLFFLLIVLCLKILLTTSDDD